MTFQIEVYAVLIKGARILETLAKESPLPEDALLAAAKFSRAAETIGQEPLSSEGITEAKATLLLAREALVRLSECGLAGAARSWLWTAIEGFNGSNDLLAGMQQARAAIQAEPVPATEKSHAFWKLIPSSWWESR